MHGAVSMYSVRLRECSQYRRGLRAAFRVGVPVALLLLATVRSATASVTIQNASQTSAASVTTATIASFDPGSWGNRVLVVGLTFGQGAPTGVGVTYGGVALVLAAGTSATNGTAHTEIWYLTSPSNTPSNSVAFESTSSRKNT